MFEINRGATAFTPRRAIWEIVCPDEKSTLVIKAIPGGGAQDDRGAPLFAPLVIASQEPLEASESPGPMRFLPTTHIDHGPRSRAANADICLLPVLIELESRNLPCGM